MEPEIVKQLIQLSRDVLVNSYCPYSKFPVGAALLCEDGTIYSGCNIESATFSAICAERTAFAKAISDGHRRFKAIVVSSNLDGFCTPCGTCRQFMAEFGLDILVITAKKDFTYEINGLDQLLPNSFGPHTLNYYNKQSSYNKNESL
ncbi:hypothetical protein BLOT_008788 [Blomia tropicalis]|nr:hypothetical protein BLOT_008788 [Blomia tropicalis]